jgi:hypothetical protein
MAKSAFGSYSSVPTTGGLGQGAAQVFAPQAIATDVTQFGKGLSTAATGAAQLISDVKDQRAEIEQKIKELEKLEKGEYDYTNGLTESVNSDLDALVDPNSEYRNKRGKVKLNSIKDINKEIDDIIEKSNNIKQYESAWRGVYDSAPDNDKFWNSQSNSWESTKDFAKNKLLNPPSQEEIDALKSGDLGAIVRKQLFDFDNGVKYDPNYNLEQKVQEQMKTYNPGTDEQSRKEYDLLTSEEKITKAKSFREDELKNFKKSLESDIKLKRERAERYAVDNGMPKSEVDNIMNDETFNATWTEEVGKAVDANQRTSTSGFISPLPKGGPGTGKSGEKGTEKAVIPTSNVSKYIKNPEGTGLSQFDTVAVAPFTIEGVGTIYSVGRDKNGNKIGYDAGGNVIADKNTFKSIEQKMLQGKSTEYVDNYNESIGKLVKGSTEIPYDQEMINSATAIFEKQNASNITADELGELGIVVDENHLKNIVVPSMENGMIAGQDGDGNTVYLPIGYKGKSNEEIIAMLTDPEGDYKADEKTVTTFEKERTGSSKLATGALALISLPVGVGFGISQYLTGSGYEVNKEDIAKILIGDIVNDNPLAFVGKGDLGKLKDPEALDNYLKRNEINLPIEKRDIAISNINDGMSIKEAVEASGGTAKKDTNPTESTVLIPGFDITSNPKPSTSEIAKDEDGNITVNGSGIDYIKNVVAVNEGTDDFNRQNKIIEGLNKKELEDSEKRGGKDSMPPPKPLAESPYDVVLGHGKFGVPPEKPLSKMTLKEVIKFQDTLIANSRGELEGVDETKGSSAVGKYQIMKKNLTKWIERGEFKEDDLFNKETQDAMFDILLEDTEYSKWEKGEITDDEWRNKLAIMWASLPTTEGKSAHNQPVGKTPLSFEQVRGKGSQKATVKNPFPKINKTNAE